MRIFPGRPSSTCFLSLQPNLHEVGGIMRPGREGYMQSFRGVRQEEGLVLGKGENVLIRSVEGTLHHHFDSLRVLKTF